MATITPPVFPPVLFPNKPVTNVSTFSYRDGETYLQTLERLRRHLNAIIGETTGLVDQIISNYEQAINDLVAAGQANNDAMATIINNALAEVEAEYEGFTNEITELVDSINNRNGAIPVQHITLTADYVVEFDPTWPTNLPRTFHFTQGGAGGHTVTWPSNVDTNLAAVNPAAGSDTFVNVVPLNGAGTAWRGFSSWSPRESVTYNVRDFGAVGDGVTDDLAAFQNAADTAALFGGGTVYVPPGTYYKSGPTFLRNFVNWRGEGDSSVILIGTDNVIFVADSNRNPGYGSGASDFTMSDLTFRGSFAGNIVGCVAQLHHSRNVAFRNIVADEVMGAGHVFDLMGCDGVYFDNLTVLGSTGARIFSEAIQVDYSAARGFSWVEDDPNFTACDGLPTINVHVVNSLFTFKRIGSTNWPCPSPFGTHTAFENQRPRGYVFSNNIVRGWGTDTTSSYRGVIHLPVGPEDFTIENNLFDNALSSSQIIFQIYRGAFLTPMTEVRNPVPPPAVQSSFPIVARNIKFINNRISGGVVGDIAIAVAGEHTTQTYATNIDISGNFINNGNDAIFTRRCRNVTLNNNRIVGGTRGFWIYECDGVTINANTVRDVALTNTDGCGIRLYDVHDCAINGNSFRNVKDTIWMTQNTSDVTVQGNTCVFPVGDVDGRAVQLLGTSTRIAITGNTFRATTLSPYGVRISGGSNNTKTGANVYSNCTVNVSLSGDAGANNVIMEG